MWKKNTVSATAQSRRKSQRMRGNKSACVYYYIYKDVYQAQRTDFRILFNAPFLVPALNTDTMLILLLLLLHSNETSIIVCFTAFELLFDEILLIHDDLERM